MAKSQQFCSPRKSENSAGLRLSNNVRCKTCHARINSDDCTILLTKTSEPDEMLMEVWCCQCSEQAQLETNIGEVVRRHFGYPLPSRRRPSRRRPSRKKLGSYGV